MWGATNTVGTVRPTCRNGPRVVPPEARMTSGARATNSAAYLRMRSGFARAPADVNADIAAVGPARLRQRLCERQEAGLSCRIVRSHVHEHADPPHPPALLRARRERPSGCAAESQEELAALHSITSSARASSVDGTSRPSVLAVFKLMTSSYLVGACTGRSAGFSPLRMRSTYDATRRYWSTLSGP